MELIKTKAQKEREMKHAKVVGMFKQLKQQYSSASYNVIINTIAKTTHYSNASVRRILEQHNVPFS